MRTELRKLLKETSLDEMKEILFFLLSQIYALLDEREQQAFFLELFQGEEGKVPSMVYYWLAKCFDAGVDPRSVCRGMVSAVGEKESLPEEVPESLKLLFEEWLDELTEEARQALARNPDLSTNELAKHLRISREGAEYIRKRLQKIWNTF